MKFIILLCYLGLVSFCYFGIIQVNLKVHRFYNSKSILCAMAENELFLFFMWYLLQNIASNLLWYDIKLSSIHKNVKAIGSVSFCKTYHVSSFLFVYFMLFLQVAITVESMFVSGRRDITSQSQFRYIVPLMLMLLYVKYSFLWF